MALALLVAVFCSLAVVIFCRVFTKRRHKYPPLAGTVFHQLLNFDRLHDWQTELSSKHKTFRLYCPSRHQIFTADPDTVEHILKTNFHKYGKGKHVYDIAKDLFGDGIFSVDGDKWRQQRKLASYEFSTRVLRDHSSTTFKTNAVKLASVISQLSAAGQAMDIQDLLMKSTMDSIFQIGFGVELCSLDGSNEKGVRFVKAFDDASAETMMRHVDFFWKVKKFLNVGHEFSLRKNIRVVDEFVYEIIRAKEDKMLSQNYDPEKKEDILSRFLDERKRDPESMSHRYLRDIILNFLIAGKDTTAGTLAWFLLMMCKHPIIQDRVAQEIQDATKCSGPTKFDEFAASLTERALESMHYLHAALSETLRLYPAVPMDPKVCLSDDTLPGGFEVREGDVLSYQPYAMGRMEFLWGEDASVFRPERWIDHNGMYRPENPYKFTAFQAGPRICLGKDFAYRQMKIFAAVLLHFFEFKLKDEKKPVRYRTMLTLHVDGGLHVCAVPR